MLGETNAGAKRCEQARNSKKIAHRIEPRCIGATIRAQATEYVPDIRAHTVCPARECVSEVPKQEQKLGTYGGAGNVGAPAVLWRVSQA